MDSSVWGKKSREKKSVPACNFYRETGLYHKTTGPPKYLQWVAEEKLIDKNHEEFTCKLPDGTRSTFLMVFSPDGTMIASTHGNHNVYITYLTNGRNVKTLSGHPRTPWCIAFHPSSNQILASGCLGGQVRVWDLHGGSEIWVVESQTVIASLAFHPTDRVLVIASYNEIHFWDWSQDKPFAKCSTTNEREKVRYVSFDKLGHRLITGIANAPRLQSQWDRVAAPQPPPQIRQAEHERRITICYRYMVEQYEQLVQRYYSLSRQGSADQRRNANNRNTQPVTIDRGTDPMEPPPIRTETRCSLCRGDVSGNNPTGSGSSIRGDDGPRPSTSSDSSTPTSEISSTVRPVSINLRNASTQHRGTDEASASRSSSQFLSSHTVLEGTSSGIGNTSTTRPEDLTRQEAIRNARDFNSSIRASYLFNRITRLRDQVETGRDILLRNAENLARRNLSSLMQPRMSLSSPEYLQGFEDIPPSLYESLPPLSPLPPPSPEDAPEDLSVAPPLPAEDPPAPPPPPPPPPPEDLPSPPPTSPPPTSLPIPAPSRNRTSPPPVTNPTPPPPPPPPPIPPPTFSLFNRLSSFLRGQRRSNTANKSNGTTTTASENSTDSAESANNGSESRSSNRNVEASNSENAISSTSDTGNNTLSADCRCTETTTSSSTTAITTTTVASSATTTTSTSGLNREPTLSSSSSSSINRQSAPRAFRDSGSNTENYESNSSDSASGRVLRRNAESSSAVARLRAQFRRLQSAYNTRDRELMLLREAEERAERSLICRLTALLERYPWTNSNNSGSGENSNRPSSAPITSPLLISQPSSSSSANPSAAPTSSSSANSPSSVPTSMASVRCGLHFLTRHIENLSSQVRMDLERGQANHIRTLWHDLHNQICALSLALRAASAPGNSQENRSNPDPIPSSGGNETFPGVTRLSSPAGNLTSQRTTPSGRAEESTSEASTSGTSSVTEEDDDESDVSPRNWFWLRRQSRRPRQHLRILNAASKRARIDFRFRMGRGGSSRPDNYYSRLRLCDLLGPSDGSNDDDDDDDEDVENEREEDEEPSADNAAAATAGAQNLSRSSPNSSNSEGPPNRGIKRKSSRILTRSNVTNQQPGTTASPSTSASPDLYYVPARARLNPRVRAFLSLRSQRNAQRQWHHPGYRSQWARDSHLAASESAGDGPSTSRQNNREDTPHREAIRRRARHVLLLMVDSITQFFENDTFTSGSSENLNERTSSLISLLELALELTDLLLTQLDSSRRRRHNYWQSRVDQDYLRTRSEEDRRMRCNINPRRQLSPVMLAMQEQERWDRWISAYTRMFQNNGSGYRDDQSVRSSSQPLPNALWSINDPASSTTNSTNNTSNNSSTHRTEIRLPVLRVNDGPVPPDEVTVNHINNRLGGRATSPRGSSPPLFYPPLFRPRLLHPRYFGPFYIDDNSTASEDSSQQENRGGGSSSPGDRFDREFFLMRGHPTAVFMGDSPMVPHHRIQAWDFTKFTLPEISNAGKNIVVEECKIHNDASVDLSQDGKILVTLLPSGRLSITTMLGVYSLEWETLGQILYTTSFEQSAVSVSLSPTTRHLIVGLASRRLPFFHTDRQTIAQIFRLEGGRPGCESESPSKGKLVLVRELDISRESTDIISLNCIRWAPSPGEGFVYGTNSGKLKVLR